MEVIATINCDEVILQAVPGPGSIPGSIYDTMV
jgi:hypothetical protein